MSVQHSVFTKESATLIGSPHLARLLVSEYKPASSAEIRASSNDATAAGRLPLSAFVNRLPVDPVRHPAELCQSVRVFRATERQLAVLIAAYGQTFWGEAAALVLGYAAAFPEDFEVRDLKERAPAGLLKSKGAIKRGKTIAGPAVRGIQAPLTPATAAFVARVAGRQKLSKMDAASLILHRHAGRIMAVMAGGVQ